MGRQVFTAGEILTAANMNDLGDATVMVFDDATARATAIPTPVEGMVTYLKEDEAVTFFDGDAFRVVGGLIAVKSAIRTSIFSASLTAGANVAVDDLSITHEVADPANRLIISAFFGVAGHGAGFGQVGIAVHDGTGFIAIGDAAGSRTRVTAGGITVVVGADARQVSMPSVTYVHTPGAGSKTYTVRALNINGGTNTIAINFNAFDADDAGRSRGVSSLVIQEVAV